MKLGKKKKKKDGKRKKGWKNLSFLSQLSTGVDDSQREGRNFDVSFYKLVTSSEMHTKENANFTKSPQ